MPHLRVRGVEKEDLVKISKALIDDMEALIQCPRDYFTLEYVHTTFICDGEENTGGYPHIEIQWFDRGEETKVKVAQAVTKHIKSVIEDDVCVYFVNLPKEDYFENGERF